MPEKQKKQEIQKLDKTRLLGKHKYIPRGVRNAFNPILNHISENNRKVSLLGGFMYNTVATYRSQQQRYSGTLV